MKEIPYTELKLITAAQSGDSEAFGRLALMYRKRIQGLVFTLTQSAQDLDDITQTIFVKAYSSLPSLRKPGRFSQWLTAITRHACLDWKRATYKRPALSLDHADQVTLPVNEEVTTDLTDKVGRALEEMDETYRLPLIYFYQQNLNYEEIAQALDLSPAGVSTRLQRAKKIFAAKMQRQLHKEEL